MKYFPFLDLGDGHKDICLTVFTQLSICFVWFSEQVLYVKIKIVLKEERKSTWFGIETFTLPSKFLQTTYRLLKKIT